MRSQKAMCNRCSKNAAARGYKWCTPCRDAFSAYRKEWYRAHAEKEIQRAMRYYSANRERINEQTRAKRTTPCKGCGSRRPRAKFARRCAPCAALYAEAQKN